MSTRDKEKTWVQEIWRKHEYKRYGENTSTRDMENGNKEINNQI
jgi:hypothetical protein